MAEADSAPIAARLRRTRARRSRPGRPPTTRREFAVALGPPKPVRQILGARPKATEKCSRISLRRLPSADSRLDSGATMAASAEHASRSAPSLDLFFRISGANGRWFSWRRGGAASPKWRRANVDGMFGRARNAPPNSEIARRQRQLRVAEPRVETRKRGGGDASARKRDELLVLVGQHFMIFFSPRQLRKYRYS